MIYRIWCSRINIISTCKLFCFKIPKCPGWCFICLEKFQVFYATQVDGNITNISQELLWASELQMAPKGSFSSSKHKINFKKMGKVLQIEESRERKCNKIWKVVEDKKEFMIQVDGGIYCSGLEHLTQKCIGSKNM